MQNNENKDEQIILPHTQNNQILMGVDYGLKRVGLALSTPTHFVFPLCTLDRSVKKTFYEALTRLIEKHNPTAFVLGLPFRADGSESITTAQVRNFATSLGRRYPLPLYFCNEFLSSFEAEEDLKALSLLGHKKMDAKKRKELLDQQAAVRILNSFLGN